MQLLVAVEKQKQADSLSAPFKIELAVGKQQQAAPSLK